MKSEQGMWLRTRLDDRLSSFVRSAGFIALATLSTALLIVLSFPRGEQCYLGWFCFVPVLRTVRGKGFLPSYAISFCSFVAGAFLSGSGVFYSHEGSSTGLGWTYIGFGIYGSAASVAIAGWGDRSASRLPIWWFAGLAVLLEAYLLIQIPVHLALTQYRCPLVVQVSAIGGIWLVSFLIWFVNFWLASLSPPKLIAVVSLILPLIFVGRWVTFPTHGLKQTFGIVQTSDSDPSHLLNLHKTASMGAPEFVVWPEFAGLAFMERGSTARLTAISPQVGVTPLVTSFPDTDRQHSYNAAAIFRLGIRSHEYFKRKLFGSESKMRSPGSLPAAAAYSDGVLGLNICFDSCYPEIIRDSAQLPRVNVIAIPTTDPPSANNFVAAVHAAYTPFRAAEEGVAILRADSHAYSQFVDPYGQIVKEIPPGERVATVTLSARPHWTPYKQFGDYFLYLVATAVVLGLIFDYRNRRRLENREVLQAELS